MVPKPFAGDGGAAAGGPGHLRQDTNLVNGGWGLSEASGGRLSGWGWYFDVGGGEL